MLVFLLLTLLLPAAARAAPTAATAPSGCTSSASIRASAWPASKSSTSLGVVPSSHTSSTSIWYAPVVLTAQTSESMLVGSKVSRTPPVG